MSWARCSLLTLTLVGSITAPHTTVHKGSDWTISLYRLTWYHKSSNWLSFVSIGQRLHPVITLQFYLRWTLINTYYQLFWCAGQSRYGWRGVVSVIPTHFSCALRLLCWSSLRIFSCALLTTHTPNFNKTQFLWTDRQSSLDEMIAGNRWISYFWWNSQPVLK